MLEFLGLLSDRYHGRGESWYKGDRFVQAGPAILMWTGFAWYFDYTIGGVA